MTNDKLSIQHYVDNFDQEEAIDLKAVQAEMTAYLRELGIDS